MIYEPIIIISMSLLFIHDLYYFFPLLLNNNKLNYAQINCVLQKNDISFAMSSFSGQIDINADLHSLCLNINTLNKKYNTSDFIYENRDETSFLIWRFEENALPDTYNFDTWKNTYYEWKMYDKESWELAYAKWKIHNKYEKQPKYVHDIFKNNNESLYYKKFICGFDISGDSDINYYNYLCVPMINSNHITLYIIIIHIISFKTSQYYKCIFNIFIILFMIFITPWIL